MTLYGDIIGFAWLVFLLVWGVLAFTNKRTARGAWWRAWWLRVPAIIIILLLLHYRVLQGRGDILFGGAVLNPALNALGAALTVLGVALAVRARLYLGRNWGQPMTLRVGHELVVGGPYARVRHPIYTGILLALLGSSLMYLWWLVLFFSAAVYFVYSTTVEERDMARQFPDTYPAYKARTWRLVPFIF